MISSRQNSAVSHCRQLLTRSSYRRKHNQFVVESFKVAALMLEHHSSIISHIYVSSDLEIPDRFKLFPYSVVDHSIMKELSSVVTPTGICVVCDIPDLASPVCKKNGVYFFLDGVRDPSNLGAILRSASAFGLDGIFCSTDCVDFFHPRVIRSSVGACFGLPVSLQADSILTQESWAKLSWVLLEPTGGGALSAITHTGPTCFVLGSEGTGISSRFKTLSNTKLCTIPMCNSVESLNVSVTAGVIAYQLSLGR